MINPVHATADNKLGRTLSHNHKYDIDTDRIATDGSAAWDGERLHQPPTAQPSGFFQGGWGVRRPQEGFRGWPLRKKTKQLVSRHP